jgi:TP901 family phage tail tape measure protein
MSNLDFSIKMNFQPSVDPQRLAAMLNVILKEMKSKLGAFGKSIDLIDGDAMAREFDKVNAKFKEISNNTAKVAKDTDKLTTALKGTTSQAGLLGKAFQFNQVTQSISAITNAIAPFINEFVEFDKQIKNIGTLGVKDFEKFNASLSSLAAEIPGTAADMANATYQAISAGVSGSIDEVTNFVRVAAKAGVAGMSDTSTAVDGLTSVINAYGLKVSEVDNVASTFFAGIKLGKTSFNEMVSSIASFVPSASALGVGFDQTTAAIARYTALGTPTAQVGTQMNAVFTLLAKGTAPLNKALAVVGTDLDTLRNKLKLPVEEGGGLVNVMRDIKLAADASGVQLAALTGRVEAAKIIESLAGSQDKYNASLSTFSSVLSEVDANAAEEAFQVAATSIAAQTDGYLATVQGMFNSLFQELGSGATTTLATLTQLSPALSGLGGLATIIPTGFGKNIADASKSIIGKLMPSLITTSATSGATAISFSAMWAALTGPVGLALAGIAAVGVGLYFLIDALVETNEEKLESAKADEEMIAGQKKVNESEIKSIESKKALISQYEALSTKTNLTADEQSKLKDTFVKLNEIYPGTINSTKSFEENLRALNEASAEDTQRLSELRDEMVKLEAEAKKATIKRVELETEVSADKLKEDLLDEVDNFLGGNSRTQVKAVDEYVNSIKDAASPEEANRALLAFNTALWNNPMFKDVPPDAKKAMAEQAKGVVDTRAAELEEKSKQANDRISQILNEAFSSGTTDISQLTADQQAKIKIDMEIAGKSEEDIANMFDNIEKDARDLKLGEILSESTKVSGDLKGAQSLDTLVESFKNAETEIEKAALGKLISNIAPEAVSATGKIKDANGDLVTSYALLEDKVEESKNKQLELNNAKLDSSQGEFFAAIDEEGEKIKENTVAMEKLQEQISQKVRMGADTSELEVQYDKLKKENDSYTKDVVGIAEKWISAGLSSEEMLEKVAVATGLSVDESAKLVKNMQDTKTAVEDTEDAVKSLGEQFSEELSGKSEEFKNQQIELFALEKARRDAIKSGNKEQINEANKKYQAQLKITKEANSELKSLESIKKSQEDLFKTTTKKVKVETDFEKAQKQFKSEETKINLSKELFAIEQEHNIAVKERQKTTEDDLISLNLLVYLLRVEHLYSSLE